MYDSTSIDKVTGDARSLVLLCLPLYANAMLVERSLTNGFTKLKDEEQLLALENLPTRISSDGGNSTLEALAIRLVGTLSAENEMRVVHLPLFPALTEKLSRSTRLKTLRELAASDALNMVQLDRLLKHRDTQVQNLATAKRWTNLDDRIARCRKVALDTVYLWCRENSAFLLAMLNLPRSPITIKRDYLHGFEQYWPDNMLEDELQDIFIEMVRTFTNLHPEQKLGMESYLTRAVLSFRVDIEIIAQYGSYCTGEFSVYIANKFITKHPDSSLDSAMQALRRGGEHRNVWSDHGTVFLAAAHPCTRQFAFGSPYLSGEQLSAYVAMVCVERDPFTAQRREQSVWAGYLSVNPNLSSVDADALSAVCEGEDLTWFTHANLSTSARASALQRSPQLTRLLVNQGFRNRTLEAEPSWWSSWMTRDVGLETLTTQEFGSDSASNFAHRDWVRCIIDLYPDLEPVAMTSMRPDHNVRGNFALKIARAIAEELGDNEDAAEVFAGLLPGRSRSFTQLCSASKRLGGKNLT